MARPPELTFEFPARFEITLLDRIERSFGRVLGFPGAFELDPQRELSAGIVLGVRPAEGDPWLGVFEAEAHTGAAAARQVLGWPDGRSICVVLNGRAYVVDTFDPARNLEIDVFPITDVLVAPSHDLVLFGSWVDVTAFGAEGFLWRTARLAWDDVALVRIEGDALVATGYDPTSSQGRFPEFRVDLRTGQSADAPYSR